MLPIVNTATFQGFFQPEQNWSQFPHQFIDALPLFETLAEIKVVLYILRHTWGYQEYNTPKHITVDEFMRGRKRADGSRIDAGLGMVKNSVIDGLNRAVKHGFIRVEVDSSDKARVEKSYAISLLSNSGVQTLNPAKTEVQTLNPGGANFEPRTEKETIERNLKENTFANAPASQPIPPPINPLSQNGQQEQLIGLPEPLKKILEETEKAQEEHPKESSAKEKVPKPKPPRSPWHDLTDAMHKAIPEAIRPVGRPHYGVNDKPAREVYEAGFSAQDVTDYVTWAYVHDKWFCCGGSGGMPILISMHKVKENIKAWTVTKGANGNGQLETGHAANVGTQQTGIRSAGGSDVRPNTAEGSGGPAPRIPSIIPAKPGIPKLAKMSNL